MYRNLQESVSVASKTLASRLFEKKGSKVNALEVDNKLHNTTTAPTIVVKRHEQVGAEKNTPN